MGDVKTYELMKGMKKMLAEPNFGMLDELRELGFDISDDNSLSLFYKRMLVDKTVRKKLIKILFDEEISDADDRKLSISAVKNGFYDFLSECGLHIV